jgi:hypothetical protein
MLAMETVAAAGDPESLGEIIERLIHCAAAVIAITAKGNSEGADALIAVAAAYLRTTTGRQAALMRSTPAPTGR